jgi:hypothetical protein
MQRIQHDLLPNRLRQKGDAGPSPFCPNAAKRIEKL